MALNLNLNAITENTSRLGARIQESIIEHTKDLPFTRNTGAAYFDAPEEKLRNVRRQLDSNSERDKLDALKTLVALISKGRNVSDYFPSVVKNVVSPNLEIRKLVYIYLLRYAEAEPDLALLSINSFQRDLADPNPFIRSLALRVLSGINVPMVANLVILAVKKCAADPSPYVRKAAALALMKCYQMDAANPPELLQILISLLKEKSPLSIGAVAVAFQAICPTRLDLLHTHYRRLCRMLLDTDPWGQVPILELLARYARCMLSKPDFSSNSSDEHIDPDLLLLLKSSEPLLFSANPAVVVAVVRIFYYLAPPRHHVKFVGPLLRLLAASKEVEHVVLAYIASIVHEARHLFEHHYSRFFIRTSDFADVKRNKLFILLNLLSAENYPTLLNEFKIYAEDPDDSVVSDAIRVIGYCARKIPDSAPRIFDALMGFIKHGSESAVCSAILVLKSLVQSRLQSHNLATATGVSVYSPYHIISDLACRIEDIRHPSARACIIWLAGQYSCLDQQSHLSDHELEKGGLAWWAPDLLRRVARTFSSEAPLVKVQLLTMAAKLLTTTSSYEPTLVLLSRYIFALARYDANCDVRDRARMLSALLVGIVPQLFRHDMDGSDDQAIDDMHFHDRGGIVLRREQVKLVLFDGKANVREEELISSKAGFIGSLELVTGKPAELDSSLRLPDWSDEGTDATLRDAEDDITYDSPASQAINSQIGSRGSPQPRTLAAAAATAAVAMNAKSAWMDLDKFYESEDEGDEQDESTSEFESEAESEAKPGAEVEEIMEEGEEEDEEEESELESRSETRSIPQPQSMIVFPEYETGGKLDSIEGLHHMPR